VVGERHDVLELGGEFAVDVAIYVRQVPNGIVVRSPDPVRIG